MQQQEDKAKTPNQNLLCRRSKRCLTTQEENLGSLSFCSQNALGDSVCVHAWVYLQLPMQGSTAHTQGEAKKKCEYMDSFQRVKSNIPVGRGGMKDEFTGSGAISESTQASCHSLKSQCTSTRSEIGLHSLLCLFMSL